MVERTELRTRRLLLRPYAPDDVEAFFANTREPDGVLYFDPMPYPPTWEQAVRFIKRLAEERWDKRTIFAVVLDGQLVGECCLVDVDAEQGSAELGYFIAGRHRRNGLAVEAASAVIEWGFDALDLSRIWAGALPANEASIRVMQRLGMQFEGSRTETVFKGEKVEEVSYAAIRDEWQNPA